MPKTIKIAGKLWKQRGTGRGFHTKVAAQAGARLQRKHGGNHARVIKYNNKYHVYTRNNPSRAKNKK